ncbi:hypothetical protein FACS189449_06500 [Alphaproteobacteria bacterium]|nr:hypothetical protein FACS189449_06500 [Alphaproteobacteria bacterium]
MEEHALSEIIRILKSPEVVVNINKLAEEHKEIKREDLVKAMKNLNEAWSYLYQAEQRKIVKMLVDSVEVQENGIKLNMNPDGFDHLFMELAA